jgi:hypothetical protein
MKNMLTVCCFEVIMSANFRVVQRFVLEVAMRGNSAMVLSRDRVTRDVVRIGNRI